MAFETISFAALLHEGFRLSGEELVAHLMMNNDVTAHAQRVLLSRLIEDRKDLELPEVSADELQAFIASLRMRLDYVTGARAEALLEEFGITVDELADAMERHLRVQKYVERFVASLPSSTDARAALLWEAFTDMTLRAKAVRSASVAVLAGASSRPPCAESLEAARARFVTAHGVGSWRMLKEKLTRGWSMAASTIERLVTTYAKAHDEGAS